MPSTKTAPSGNINVSDLRTAPAALSAVEQYVALGHVLVEHLDSAGWEIPGGEDFKQRLTAFEKVAQAELQPGITAADGKQHTKARSYQEQ